MEINRRFKDTLFRKVFNNKKDLLSLYNALKDGRSDKLVKLTDKKELERIRYVAKYKYIGHSYTPIIQITQRPG